VELDVWLWCCFVLSPFGVGFGAVARRYEVDVEGKGAAWSEKRANRVENFPQIANVRHLKDRDLLKSMPTKC